MVASSYGPAYDAFVRALLPAAVLLLAACSACFGEPVSPASCRGEGTGILVETAEHRLVLCENDTVTGQFAVALGRGGTGKTREGDRKTPLGDYPLGPPRASASFGTFIPIGYPTREQARAGLTGSAVGIHGPRREAGFLGRFGTSVDWTLGCIAVASDEEIETIARWVRELGRAGIRIR